MLYGLILLTLVVNNNLAFELYGDTDDFHLWRRGGPSVRTDDKDCKKDILVIWDNSQSVGQGPFKDNVVPFLVNLVKSPKLNVGKEGAQFGFITFSSDERTKTLLKIGEKTSPDDLETWLKSLKYPDLMGDRTYTGKALKLANETFSLKSPLNHRPGIADVILLFTDGEPRARTRTLIAEQERLAENCSKSLKDDKDVKIIGLAVGSAEKFLHFIEKWSSEGSVFQAKITELNNVLSELVADTCENAGECTCTKPISPFIVYAGPGQQSATVSWPMPDAEKEDGAACERGSVVPPGAVSGGRYSLGKHIINYSFSNGAANPTIANCLVEFTVVPCNCPATQTVTGKVKDGDKTIEVNWQEPEPTCPTTASPDNPKISESFSVGKYTRTYKYTYSQPGRHSFQLECHVNIVIRGELCGNTAFDLAAKVCCCGKIYTKKLGYKCCGVKYHNTLTKECCNDQRAIVMPHGNCP